MFEVRVLVSVRPGELRRWEKHNLVDEDVEDADEKFAGRDAACRENSGGGGKSRRGASSIRQSHTE
jgi:hypothetical protein